MFVVAFQGDAFLLHVGMQNPLDLATWQPDLRQDLTCWSSLSLPLLFPSFCFFHIYLFFRVLINLFSFPFVFVSPTYSLYLSERYNFYTRSAPHHHNERPSPGILLLPIENQREA